MVSTGAQRKDAGRWPLAWVILSEAGTRRLPVPGSALSLLASCPDGPPLNALDLLSPTTHNNPNATKGKMEEDTQWHGIENGINDPEELQVIYRTLDSYQ